MRDLEEEPGPLLGLVDPTLDQAGATDISPIGTQAVYLAQQCRQIGIVFPQFGEHVVRSHIACVAVGYALEPGDMADGSKGGPTNLASALGDRVSGRKY